MKTTAKGHSSRVVSLERFGTWFDRFGTWFDRFVMVYRLQVSKKYTSLGVHMYMHVYVHACHMYVG